MNMMISSAPVDLGVEDTVEDGEVPTSGAWDCEEYDDGILESDSAAWRRTPWGGMVGVRDPARKAPGSRRARPDAPQSVVAPVVMQEEGDVVELDGLAEDAGGEGGQGVSDGPMGDWHRGSP